VTEYEDPCAPLLGPFSGPLVDNLVYRPVYHDRGSSVDSTITEKRSTNDDDANPVPNHVPAQGGPPPPPWYTTNPPLASAQRSRNHHHIAFMMDEIAQDARDCLLERRPLVEPGFDPPALLRGAHKVALKEGKDAYMVSLAGRLRDIRSGFAEFLANRASLGMAFPGVLNQRRQSGRKKSRRAEGQDGEQGVAVEEDFEDQVVAAMRVDEERKRRAMIRRGKRAVRE